MRRHPTRMRTCIGFALICTLCWAASWTRPATAATRTLYRCVGIHGEAVFTSERAGYTRCRPVFPGRHDVASARAGATAARPSGAPGYREFPAKGGAGAAHMPLLAGRGLRHGTVYRLVHADGAVEYTNVRPPVRPGWRVDALFTYIATCAACDVHSAIDWTKVPLNLAAYAGVVRAAAARYGISRALLRAMIQAESAFNPRAVSDKGARGLMQLMPGTASAMGVGDVFDAAQNIRGGARYLAGLLKAFGGDERLAAAAYNAGPAAVRKYGGVPPYAQTRLYVERVGVLRRRYAAVLDMAMADGRAQAGPG